MSMMSSEQKLDTPLNDLIAANGKAQKPRQRRTPYGRTARQPSTRVFVGNLHYSVTWQQLKDKFREAGEVVRARILELPDGKSKGCGVVEFATADGAAKAIAELNNADINGRQIFVREDISQAASSRGAPRGAAAAPPAYAAAYEEKEARRKLTHDIGTSIRFNHPPEHQVYIGNLPWTCTWQDLKNLASKFGTVVRADILEDASGRSRGSGTVVFSNTEAAAKCIEELHGSQFETRELIVRYDVAAQRRAEMYEPGAKLYVGNLPWSASWQDLKDLFAQVGEVVRADVVLDRATGRSKGFGTVTFAKKADAEKAIAQLNETEFRGRNIQVRVDTYTGKASQQ